MYFNLAYKLLIKINNENIITNIIKDINYPLSNRIDLVKKLIVDKPTTQNPNITNELLDQLNLDLKTELSQLSLKDLLNDKFGMALIVRMQDYKISIENLTKELQEKVFNSQKDFFEVLNFFKYWQQSSSGNRYLIRKTLMKDF